MKPLSLSAIVKSLKKCYGPPVGLPTTDPFELVVWENVAYLTTPARQLEAFVQLKQSIGTDPESLVRASRSQLEQITSKGILKSEIANKLHACAEIALNEFDGDLAQVVGLPVKQAKKALMKFPGIGEPSAEKILLFADRRHFLPLDSNGLRVLIRLGLVREEKSYSQTYAASRSLTERTKSNPKFLQDAHLLLQQHGRTICKRTCPLCESCPLRTSCPKISVP